MNLNAVFTAQLKAFNSRYSTITKALTMYHHDLLYASYSKSILIILSMHAKQKYQLKHNEEPHV